MEPLTPEHVKKVFSEKGVEIELRFFEASTATSQQAADNIGCELGQIVKSLCFMVETAEGTVPILVLASGDQRIDDRKLAEYYQVSRKKVKVATPEECLTIYGYIPGSVPPLGHRQENLPTFIDLSLRRFPQLYAAGGAHNAIFPIQLDVLQQATQGQMFDVIRDVTA